MMRASLLALSFLFLAGAARGQVRVDGKLPQLPADLGPNGGLKVECIAGTCAGGGGAAATVAISQTGTDNDVNVSGIIDQGIAGLSPWLVHFDNTSLAVTGTFWQATQPVSGTFWQATQPVSIASNIGVINGASGFDVNIANVPLPISLNYSDRTNSGTLGALNDVVSIDVTERNGVGFIIAAGFNGILTPEYSYDGGTTWNGGQIWNAGVGNTLPSITIAGAVTQRTILLSGGMTNIRVRVSTYTSGSATLDLRATMVSTNTFIPVRLPGGIGTSFVPIGGYDGAANQILVMKAASTAPAAADISAVVALSPNGNQLTDTQLRASAVPISVASLPLPTGAATSTIQTDRTQFTKITDGTRDAIIKAASTLPLLTDTALVTTQRDPLPAGTQTIGGITQITTAVTPGTANINLGKAEDATHTTGDTGVLSLGVRKDTNTQVTNADSDYTAQSLDAYGATFARSDHPNRINCVVTTSTATTLTAVGGSCAAPGAGLSIYINTILFSASAAGIGADAFPTLKYGTGGACGTGTTVFWGALSAAAIRASDTLNTPIKIPANNEVCWISTTAGSKFINIIGFIAP